MGRLAGRRLARPGTPRRAPGPRTEPGPAATADAVTQGRVGLEHARVLATLGATSDVRRQVLAGDSACNEAFLLAQAQLLGADQFRTLVHNWAAAADPDADDRGYREAGEREFLELSRTIGGFHLAGFLTDEHGHALTTALSAVAGGPAAGDERSTAQRLPPHALVALARLTLDHGLTGTGAAVRPHLSVHVSLDQLDALTAGVVTPLRTRTAAPSGQAGWADADADADDPPGSDCRERSRRVPGLAAPPWPGGAPAPPQQSHPSGLGGSFATPATFDDGTPVPASLLARLACDREVTRIVFGPPGIVLDVGRARRTVTGQLRRAVIARDRHCAYPRCTAPPALGEVHHVRHWADDGVTSVDNSILLCWHHHDLVHRTAVVISRTDGTWTFTDRHDNVIREQAHDAAA